MLETASRMLREMTSEPWMKAWPSCPTPTSEKKARSPHAGSPRTTASAW